MKHSSFFFYKGVEISASRHVLKISKGSLKGKDKKRTIYVNSGLEEL